MCYFDSWLDRMFGCSDKSSEARGCTDDLRDPPDRESDWGRDPDDDGTGPEHDDYSETSSP